MGKLGLIFNIGHGGSTCPSVDTSAPPFKLVIIATNGVHEIKIRWCTCSRSLGKASEHWVQLMRMRWFPASHARPKTAVTFDCLDLFHKLTLQGKLTGYDYYQSLLHLTNNTDVDLPRVSNFYIIQHSLILICFIETLRRIHETMSPLAASQDSETSRRWSQSRWRCERETRLLCDRMPRLPEPKGRTSSPECL